MSNTSTCGSSRIARAAHAERWRLAPWTAVLRTRAATTLRFPFTAARFGGRFFGSMVVLTSVVIDDLDIARIARTIVHRGGAAIECHAVRGFVANTDFDWFTFLAARQPLEEVNFWQPSGGDAFRALDPGEPFFFRLKKPHYAIAGFGLFARHEVVTAKPRLGQGTFRVAVTQAYHGACAVSGEHSLPALEAAHIRPFGVDGTHDVGNGVLLRADIHRLFDQGYVTITPEHRFVVSQRLAEEWENGKIYYATNGTEIALDPVSWTPSERQLPADDVPPEAGQVASCRSLRVR